VKPRSLAEVADAVAGAVWPPAAKGVVATGVVVDSRSARPGDLFFALPGEHVDGHGFVADALNRGAAAAVVRARRGERPGHDAHGASERLIEVDDPAHALLRLAGDERSRLDATVVGITGSTGKTCTKDFTAAALSRTLDVVASEASFNNEVGLPLTILRATGHTEAVICEMGSRGPGHIRLLCEVARPHVGVVTNVGAAHMELFGSPRVLRDAKAELPEALPAEGAAVLNADDAVTRSYATRTAARVILFGAADDAIVRAQRLRVGADAGVAEFELVTPDGSAPVRLPAPGEHLVPDALAAAAVGWFLGVPTAEIARGLATASIATGRMEVFETPDGVRVVNDAYNANPTSMAAALKAVRRMAGRGRCFAVLGQMAELGPISDAEHERIGELAARLGIDALVVVGREAALIKVGAEREGVEPERIILCEDVAQAVRAVRSLASPGDVVLVKASRVERLERVAEALREGASVAKGIGA
jgi:UDP-N-acetylmuramoyl-tripeptide--D-alanyl-D-alanine ligase